MADRLESVLDRLVAGQIAARAEARAGKDFTTADAIRDRLAAPGSSWWTARPAPAGP